MSKLPLTRIFHHIPIKNREGVASKVHRQGTIDGLKKFNARRKLKVSWAAFSVFFYLKIERIREGGERTAWN